MKLKSVLTEQDVVVPGIGTMPIERLQQDLNNKLQDLIMRAQQNNFQGIGKSQFDVLALYWDTLQKYMAGAV